jgi:hypothetical protein
MPGTSLSTQISNARDSADIAMTGFLNSLGDAERGTYVGNNIQAVLDKVGAAKNDRFQYLSEDLTGTDNNITSTAYYVQRTGDLTSMATDIGSVASKQVNASSINSSLINRQGEINEWSNNNKLDTLFFLQILFITLTFISTMVFLNSNGYISSYFLNLWIILSSFFAVFILITRARKTSVLRDGRYWHKMRFGAQKAPVNSGATCPGAPQPAVVSNPPVAPTCNTNLSLLGDLPESIPVGWGGRPPAAAGATS